jgi:uncharacterized protein YbjQ (UPF0145 family)
MTEIAQSGTWGSALSTAEFAAIRSVGFEPVGQVLGAVVYNIGWMGSYTCPAGWSGRFLGGAASMGVGVSGQSGWAPFRPMAQTMYQARHTAIGRMTAECSELGGHGIVGVRLTVGPFPAGGALEFRAIGTAVRLPGAPPLARPFSSDLSGQEFAKLVRTGWMPVGLALGISIGAVHDDFVTRSQTYWNAENAEVTAYTELVNATRHDARTQLEADVAKLGAEGVVTAVNDLHIQQRECPVREGFRDHIAEATLIGTAMTRFTAGPVSQSRSLAILSLDPERRRAARGIRIGL